MKRITVFLMVISACIVLPQVRAGDIGGYSNIVGGHKLELASGYNFVGLNFRNPQAPENGAYCV